MSLFTDLLKLAFPLVLSVAKDLADSQVNGADLNKNQKQALFTAYVVINVHGDDLVESTANEFDDQTLQALSEFAADTLLEAGITLPVIPEELENQKAMLNKDSSK